MSDLPARLRQALEFDDSHSNMSGRDAMHVKGITIDAANARLQPLLTCLVECVDDMEWLFANWGTNNSAVRAKGYDVTRTALARLTEELEKLK